MVKAIEAVKNLKSSHEEIYGVGSAGCCESKRWNRRGLIRSVAQNNRNNRYILKSEIQKKDEQRLRN
jgi:hypothetical protein